ncbi:hypothetical protein EfmGK941_19230 [Enterococcus faecium]|nr:hypothetical protein EfmGK941_19230 [Enterococcus faecium]
MIEQTLYQDLNRPYVDILQKRAIYLGKEFLIGSIDSELLSFGIGLTLLIHFSDCSYIIDYWRISWIYRVSLCR